MLEPFSVTAMLGKHSGFEDVPDSILVPAQQRGTAVHRFCAAVAANLFPEPLAPIYKGYGDSFLRFFSEACETLFVEELVECPEFGYYGHPDIVVRMRTGKKTRLIDLKTGPVQRSWFLQIPAYWHLLEYHKGIKIDEAGCLILDPEGGTPRWVDMPEFKLHFAVWRGYMNFWHFMYDGQAKPERSYEIYGEVG